MSTTERMERAVELIDHPPVQFVNYDPTNFYLGGSEPLLAASTFEGRIRNGHIKDGVYRTGRKGETPVGKGERDYPAIFNTGASVAMHIEHCNDPAQVKDGAEYIRTIINQLK